MINCIVFCLMKRLSPTSNQISPHCTRLLNALLEATDSWAFDIDHRNVNAVVFLDLKKNYFDTVDHDVLLAKLSLYRIQESTYDWFE